MGIKFTNPTVSGGGGGGTVTEVSSANVDIAVSSGTTTPILTLNSATTATASKIVKRDTNGDIAGNVLGNAATVTTNANLTGDVTSVGNTTTLTNAPVIAKVLTGYTSGAGVLSTSDSILQAIQKLNGNDATNANLTGDVTSVGNATTLTNAPVIAKVLTGYVSGAGTVSATDSILQAIQKLNGNNATNANLTGDVTSVGNATTLTNAPVIAKVLTGYVSGAGTVSAADSILTAIQKLNGNAPVVATSSAVGLVKIAVTPNAGQIAAPIVPILASYLIDTVIAGTSETTVSSHTPLAKANYIVNINFRVVTGTTNVTVKVVFKDGGGTTVTNTLLNVSSSIIGYYSLTPLFITADTVTPIDVKITASAANQVYVSTSIIGS